MTAYSPALDGTRGNATVDLNADSAPILFVVVDTEEEFDWSAPFSRTAWGVSAMRHIGRAHRIFARYNVKPTYVIDYPIATKPDGYRPLQELLQAGECTIGAHLHPWVNPPFDEELGVRASFACNLGIELEYAKLRMLHAAILENLGVDARIYKAGRYGFGRTSLDALERLQFEIDLSIIPHLDFGNEGGPSFTAFDAAPFFFGSHPTILEIPCTAGYVGLAGEWGPALNKFASQPAARTVHLMGVLTRLGITNRIVLSPEGHSLAEMRALTRELLSRGIRAVTLTFHSPSVCPGHTPYVRSARELDAFLSTIEAYCDFFFGTLGGISMTPYEFRSRTLESMFASVE